MAKKDLFGREKDAERREAIEREAAEEVERLTRRAAPSPGGILGGGMGPSGGGNVGPPSELEMMANSVRERPRGRGATGLGGRNPNPATAFPFGAAMLSGPVGSGFGPGGLNPGPGNRGSGSAVPAGARPAPSPDYADAQPLQANFGRSVEEDEEEMSITEMALTDYAARSGSSLEDVAVQVDVESAEEARDRAMRQFHERQQSRPPMAVVTDPFASAAMRSKSASAAAAAQAKLNAPGGRQRPESAGSVLAARIAARRRQDEQKQAGGLLAGPQARPSASGTPGGALDRLPARRRPVEEVAVEPEKPTPATGARHAEQRQATRAQPKSPPAARTPRQPPPAAIASPAPAPDPNAHLYEALMEERRARLELEAKLEALAAAAAGPPTRKAAPGRKKEAPATKAAAPKKGAPAKKAAPSKAPARKAVPEKKPAAPKKAPAKASPAKAVPAKQPVAPKKAPAKRVAAPKKAPAKAGPAKKAAPSKAPAGKATRRG